MSAATSTPEATASPAISVVIPTLGHHDLLARVLDGFATQEGIAASGFEVIVVADRSEPDPAGVDRAVGTRTYPVSRLAGERPGASSNRNVGWRAARAPIVLFTDNDTIPTPRLLAEHLRAHREGSGDGTAVIGNIRWAPGLEVTPFMKWVEDGMQFDLSALRSGRISWAQLYTANASIKKSLLERVGGFDEVNLPYLYEDLDWAYRARSHGLVVRYAPEAIVDHWRPVTLEDWHRRIPRLAAAEASFTRLHPELPPYFHQRFSLAARTSPGRGRALKVLKVVPRSLPIVGPAAWKRAGHHWAQELAPGFLVAWDAAQAELAGLAAGAAQPAGGAEETRPSNPGGS
jgi:GT2 family glycosyltransferase